MAFKTTCPSDESRQSGDHRVSGTGVWMHKCSSVQVLAQQHALEWSAKYCYVFSVSLWQEAAVNRLGYSEIIVIDDILYVSLLYHKKHVSLVAFRAFSCTAYPHLSLHSLLFTSLNLLRAL